MDQVFEAVLLNIGLHDLHHLLSDELLLGCFCVASGLDLSWSLLGESNGEHSDDITIGGLGLHESLDKGVPLLDHGASMVSGDVHTVEVRVAIVSLDFVNLELELSPGGTDLVLLVLHGVVAVIQRDRDNTTFETLRGLGKTCSLVTRHQSDNSFIESWSLDIVPLFLGEWMGSKTLKMRVSH